MSEQNAAPQEEIVNDAATADDVGFSTDAGNLPVEEETQEEVAQEASEEQSAEEEEGVQAETQEEFEQEVKDAIEEGATEEEVADMVKEFKLKVNGKEVTKKIDLSDEDALKRELQLAAAGQQSMQKQKELEKLYQQEIQRLQNDPFSVLKELGIDTDNLNEEYMKKRVQELEKSPEQKEREKLQQELQKAREEAQKLKEEKENQAYEKLKEEQAGILEQEVEEALDAHPTLPKSQKTVSRIADAMLWAMENGFEDVSVSDVIPTVEREIQMELEKFMSDLPEDLFEKYIGKKNIDRLRKRRLKQLQKTNNVNNIKPTSNSINKEKEEQSTKKKMKAKDYFRQL
jgi:hypothetical protein